MRTRALGLDRCEISIEDLEDEVLANAESMSSGSIQTIFTKLYDEMACYRATHRLSAVPQQRTRRHSSRSPSRLSSKKRAPKWPGVFSDDDRIKRRVRRPPSGL